MGEVSLLDVRRTILSAEGERWSSVGRRSQLRRVGNWTQQMMEELFVSFLDAVGDSETMEGVHAALGGEDWFMASLWQWLVD